MSAATLDRCVTPSQAEQLGWSRWRLTEAVRTGRVVRLRHGAYLDAETWARLDPRGQHLMRIRADQLVLGTSWMAARRSAAVLFDLPLIGPLPERPQLLRVGGGRPHDRHYRSGRVAPVDVGSCLGISTVSPARTICDIARAEDFRNAVVVADAALRGGVLIEDLLRCVRFMQGWPGAAAARRVVEFADPRAESPLESISRCGCAVLGIPEPELQVTVCLGEQAVARVDMLWRGMNTMGEADGFAKYGTTDAERRTALELQKRRTELLEDLGFEVVHWGWQDAWRPAGVLDARLRRAFARGSQQALDPRVRLVTTDCTVLAA